MKTCTKCKIKKDISEFATVTKNNVKYIRHQCTGCRDKQDYQVRLKRLLKNGSTNVHTCESCFCYFKSSFKAKHCVSCRNKNNNMKFINGNGNYTYYSSY